MYHYQAYQLRIASDIALNELQPAAAGQDVEIRLKKPEPRSGGRNILWEQGRGEAVFTFPGAGRFEVRGGREVIVTPEPQAEPAFLRLYVQGMMLAAILHQRGYFVLHASLVNVDGGAIAFVGAVGAGKSTMAAALHSRGCAVVADDNAAVDLGGTIPMTVPAFPSLKVYPAVAESLGFGRSSLQPMHHSQLKQAQGVGQGFSDVPLPLDAIYVLDRTAPEGITRLAAAKSVAEMIRHSVPTRWGVAGDGAHLVACSRLAGSIPVFHVRTFSSLDQVPVIAARIEAHRRGEAEAGLAQAFGSTG